MIIKLITRTRRAVATAMLAGVAVVAAACGSQSAGSATAQPPSTPAAGGCITHFNADTDYFPVKQQLKYAENFTISYHNSYQVLTVKEPTVGGKPESYVLVRCGAPKPTLTGALAKAPQITTPVKSLFSASTTHLPSLEALGRLDVLTGVASKALISSKAARQRVAQPGVTEFAPAGTADAEKIVAAKPDALVTAGQEDPSYATVRRAGIPVLADAEYLEPTPLGEAEWIKYFAALTGTERKAARVFDGIAADYNAAVDRAAAAKPTTVLVNQPYQGVWTMPTGGTPMGRLITDAGGTWPWQQDRSTASKNADLETVYKKSGTAKIWITSTNWKTKKEALASEPRFADFTAYRSGQIWAPSLQVNAAGGNNMYELGVLRPDLVVGDLIAIMHPDLEPGHTFTFYQRLD
ncbi:ABC transporter substrate-binding protein [Microlunatus sp. Gsoil 973]|uniref:ABC transporter substrate-binding protein n=1 Tax=Microlunatus sp. Gsoil 973 TaxID=2672569 RepID=UPI0012B44C86|nr:ABC transporter substrate-binding protein [Microlunatus sp. Gsoil 973]QGN35045.1 ABC transporter substrate-binding protein [Microlunatus sp. Gsoil 973]